MAHKTSFHAIYVSMLIAASVPAAWAQIYSCVDGFGRKITSDRPIAECKDKDQKELNPSGTIKRVIRPSATAQEQLEIENRLKAETQEKAQIEEERRRNRALLSRYPNSDAHQRERANSLMQVDDVIKTAQQRIEELGTQNKKHSDEMEFYKKDPAKAPAYLKRQIDENTKEVAAQRRFVGEQSDERKRVNARFDEELARLKKLWAQAAAPTTATASAPAAAAKK